MSAVCTSLIVGANTGSLICNNTDEILVNCVSIVTLKIGLPLRSPSLGTRPSKNRKGGSGKLAGVEVYTAPGMQAHFQLDFD